MTTPRYSRNRKSAAIMKPTDAVKSVPISLAMWYACVSSTQRLVPISMTIRRTMMCSNARHRLESGPAAPVSAISRFGLRKLRGWMGTGFAQPTCATIMQIVPNGSRCLSGLSVMRPRLRAVGSPSLYAMSPCADSCTENAMRSTGRLSRYTGRSRRKLLKKVNGLSPFAGMCNGQKTSLRTTSSYVSRLTATNGSPSRIMTSAGRGRRL